MAQSTDSSARLEAIRQKMEEGQGLFLAKDFERAADVFEKGYELYPYSAFLFNAGVCYERMGKNRAALAAFQKYLQKDPDAPDAAAVKKRIEHIEASLGSEPTEAQAGDASNASDGDDTDSAIKSLVVIETEPVGAPVLVYMGKSEEPDGKVGNFSEESPDWKLVATRTSPVNLTLAVGRYHIVVSKFREFNRSETDIDVSPGHVHHFRANLSQGKFMGFLEITSNVVGAAVFLDPDESEEEGSWTVWGETPHNALVAPGPHKLVLRAPGYEPTHHDVIVSAGEKRNLTVKMERVGFGVVRVDADVQEVIVTVDGRIAGSWRQGESALELELRSGSHQLLVQAKGYKDLRKMIEVPRGQLVPLRAKMVRKFPRGAAWTQAILAAGILGAGIYLGVESNRLQNELSQQKSDGYLYAEDPDIKKGFWFSVGANSAFAISGILTGLSVYNFIRDPYPDPVLYRGKNREFENVRQPEGQPNSTPPTASFSKRPGSVNLGSVNRGSVNLGSVNRGSVNLGSVNRASVVYVGTHQGVSAGSQVR